MRRRSRPGQLHWTTECVTYLEQELGHVFGITDFHGGRLSPEILINRGSTIVARIRPAMVRTLCRGRDERGQVCLRLEPEPQNDKAALGVTGLMVPSALKNILSMATMRL